MTNRLADAISPYLRSHADNPVDWYPWGEEAFAEARRRDVPLFISIGYSTCHWCHVMARESFDDPQLAAELNARFVAVKVDREEHPDVDAGYLAAASAFTRNLGWPLSVFATPEGLTFFAGTYFPPDSRDGQSSFRQVLAAVTEAWEQRRDQVQETAGMVVNALAAAQPEYAETLPDGAALDTAVAQILEHEDAQYGGFGGAPKFPVAPALGFLLGRASGTTAALRTLAAMAASPLRDDIDGGFFRYATRRDWSQPHYERMLYDNAQLLRLYADAAVAERAAAEPAVAELAVAELAVAEPAEAPASALACAAIAEGIARYLLTGLRLPTGGFACAQDSESTVDGTTVEGGYYALDAAQRARQVPPGRDEKILTGWNGLAIGALAHAGFVLEQPDWIHAARVSADILLARHRRRDGSLARASIGDRVSDASATLEDYGMLAAGLIELALVTGRVDYAVVARELVDATMVGSDVQDGPQQRRPFAVPGGGDPVLAARSLATRPDPSEGAYPSGSTAVADAAHRLFLITGESRYLHSAQDAMRLVSDAALASPLSFGAAWGLMSSFAADASQLVIVLPDLTGHPEANAAATGHADVTAQSLVDVARQAVGVEVTAVATQAQASDWAAAGFDLFTGRVAIGGDSTAYLCRNFVCALPTSDADELTGLLG